MQLIAFNELGCSDTLLVSGAIRAVSGGNVKVPNAFSPSLAGPGYNGGDTGEPINDVFLPRVEGVIKFRMLLFNKWGELLFESTGQKKDGTAIAEAGCSHRMCMSTSWSLHFLMEEGA